MKLNKVLELNEENPATLDLAWKGASPQQIEEVQDPHLLSDEVKKALGIVDADGFRVLVISYM